MIAIVSGITQTAPILENYNILIMKHTKQLPQERCTFFP